MWNNFGNDFMSPSPGLDLSFNTPTPAPSLTAGFDSFSNDLNMGAFSTQQQTPNAFSTGLDAFSTPTTATAFDAFTTTPAPAPNNFLSTPTMSTNDLFTTGNPFNSFPAPNPAPAPTVSPFDTTGGAFVDSFGNVANGGIISLPQGFPRDEKKQKWPVITDMKDTIYGCAFVDNATLIVGDAAGMLVGIQTNVQHARVAVTIDNGGPVVSLACDAKTRSGVFTADAMGNIRQWDIINKKSMNHGQLGHCLAVDRQTGILAIGSWARRLSWKDVRQNRQPTSIQLPGKCHCVDLTGHYVFAGVNRDPSNVAVMIYDMRRSNQPVKTHKLDPKEGMIRCIMRKGGNGGFLYGTQNGYIGANKGGNSRTTVTDAVQTANTDPMGGFGVSGRSPSSMVNSIAWNPLEKKCYISFSNGKVMYEKRDGYGWLKFKCKTSISRIAFSHNHFAVCKSYNYFDKGASKQAGQYYPYHEVVLRKLTKK